MSVDSRSYKPPLLFKNGHVNTIYRTLFLNYPIEYQRKRITTPDRDFLDLDFSTVNSDKIVILIHGLEGSSGSKYILSTAGHLNKKGYDIVSVNQRSCSGEPNLTLGTYHSGKTDDLETVIRFIEKNYTYKQIFLAGYSLGGNQILKYLGEKGNAIRSKIRAAVTVSVPCDLEGSSQALARFTSKLYMERFLKTLKVKTLEKMEKFPDSGLDKELIINAKNFYDFDNAVTAPVFGYKNAQDYWRKNSSKGFIPEISIPALLITALDDPFLNKSCYPVKEAGENPYFNLEINRFGGHVGFNIHHTTEKNIWMENRILQFFDNLR